MSILRRMAVIISLLLSMTSVAQAWWNPDWTFRKKITLQPAVTAPQGPILVRLHTGNFNYFTDLMPGGVDLRFISGDDKTPLAYHIEKLDVGSEQALIWVQAPPVGSNTIYMYYGNPAATSVGDAKATYDIHQVLTYHFNEKDGEIRDQTAYGHNSAEFTAERSTASLIGEGVKFTGAGKLVIPDAPGLRVTGANGYTFSAWLRIDAAQNDAVLLERVDDDKTLRIGIDQDALYARVTADGATVETPRTAQLQLKQWQHIALNVAPLRMTLYIDGKEAAAIDTKAVDMGGAITVGAAATGSNFLIGEVDELEIANLARPAQWFKDEFAEQGPDAAALTYGEDEQNDSGGSTSYFGTILRSVTIDGWVVIAVLMLMAAISWMVMASKAFVIKKVGTDDRAFLHAFHKLEPAQTDALDQNEDEASSEMDDSDLLTAVFGKQEHYQNSPLFRIYHSGIHELKLRFGKSAGAAASGLSPQAVSAIRASLDATMVRELQKLNSQMVLLTIAISGGPFLGLLGTVVGVMITFAAIAATGDVNINAIAPGIAAALVATVAGLAVAIPALFGYNYLGSRIKSISADMQVFVDEFIGRIAESYKDRSIDEGASGQRTI